MIRILFVLPSLRPTPAARQAIKLATGLPLDTFDVSLCALERRGPPGERWPEQDLPLARLDRRWNLDPVCFWRLVRGIRRCKPDVVHNWSPRDGGMVRCAAAAAGVRHVVTSIRGHFPKIMLGQLRGTRLIAHTSTVHDACLGQGWPRTGLSLIRDGVEDAARPSGASRETVLRELELPADARVLGAGCPLVPSARLKQLVWAACILEKVYPNVFLLLLGDGPQRWRLQRFADQIMWRDTVRIVGPRADLPRILSHLDVYLSANRQLGHGDALMEAMGAGCPILAADTAENRELIAHGTTGFLTDKAISFEYAQLAKRLLDDTAEAGRLGMAAQQRAQNVFSPAKSIQQHAKLYRELISTAGSVIGSRIAA